MYLPLDVIVEILLRLPVKSLFRFKCVSKNWRFLISHPRFVKMHLSRTQSLGRARLLSDSSSIDIFSVDLETVSDKDDKITILGLEFPGRQEDETHALTCVGSCNGLLGVLNEVGELFLYNPSTQECKKILAKEDFIDFSSVHGFGYADSIDDYKLVRILYPGNVVEVYSLRKASWTRFRSRLFFPKYYFKMGVHLNGAIHWAFVNLEGSCVIAVFDLVEEKFKKALPLPDCLLKGLCGYSLGVARGRLCLATEASGRENQFWVMEEYGVEGSWMRMSMPKPFSRVKPLGYLKKSETMMLITEEGLVFWDVKDGKMKNVEVGRSYLSHGVEQYSVVRFGEINRDDDDDDDDDEDYGEDDDEDEDEGSKDNGDGHGWCDAHLYVESLVSLHYNSNITTEDSYYKNWFD